MNDDQTLDLVDPQGNVLAWNGPSISPIYTNVLGQNPSEEFVRVTQNGLRTYLTVGINLAHGKLYVMASEPLELNSPISNRFVQKVSISDNLSQKLKEKVTLQLPPFSTSNSGDIRIPIVDKEGNVIVEFSVIERSLENEMTSTVEVCDTLVLLSLYSVVSFLSLRAWCG